MLHFLMVLVGLKEWRVAYRMEKRIKKWIKMKQMNKSRNQLFMGHCWQRKLFHGYSEQLVASASNNKLLISSQSAQSAFWILHKEFLPTNSRHLRNTGGVHVLGEFWFIVIDIVDFNDKFRLWLHLSSSFSVYSLGT